MSVAYETFMMARPATITVVDGFVRSRGTSGAFPPPLGTLRFVLAARFVANVATALDPPVVLKAITRGSGVFVVPNEGTIGGGPALAIPPGRYRLVISSDVYQTDTRDVDWPTGAPNMPVVVLAPGPAYPFPDVTMVSNALTLVRGSILVTGTAKPVAGAVVSFTAPANTWPFATCRSDANGGWALAIPIGAGAAPFDATLHVALPDGTSFDAAPVTIQPGAENSVPAFRIASA